MFKPVDAQQSIAQIPMSEKIQQIQQQHADLQQRHFALQLNEERKRMQQTIQDSEEAERLKLRDEQKRGRPGSDKEKRRGDRSASSKETAPVFWDDTEGTHIDIKV